MLDSDWLIAMITGERYKNNIFEKYSINISIYTVKHF
jgi:hypothetical protein